VCVCVLTRARALLCVQFYLGNFQQAINEASTKKLVNKDLATERDVLVLRSYLAQRKVCTRPAHPDSSTRPLREVFALGRVRIHLHTHRLV
jgi:hypothetical protein